MARDLKRIEKIMYKIGRLWVQYPDQRLFQLLFNYTMLGTKTEHLGIIRDPFHYTDEDLEKQLNKVLKKLNGVKRK